MSQISSFVDWNHVLLTILVVVAFGYFIQYSVNLTRGLSMRGIAYLDMGLASIMMAAAARIAYPGVMSGGSGFNYWLVVLCIVMGSLLVAYGALSNFLRLRSRKGYEVAEAEETE